MKSMDVAQAMIQKGVVEVRSDGTVWKLRNLNRTPLKEPRRMETQSGNGYLKVHVNADGRQFGVLAHRLVWTVLRGPIPDGMDINHKDGNRTNNHPDNLEVLTRGDNHRHAYRVLGRKPSKSVPAPIVDKLRASARALREKGLSFSAIARELGVSQTTAFRAAEGAKAIVRANLVEGATAAEAG